LSISGAKGLIKRQNIGISDRTH